MWRFQLWFVQGYALAGRSFANEDLGWRLWAARLNVQRHRVVKMPFSTLGELKGSWALLMF